MTHPRIPLAGVIGSPVAHSRSPRLHGHWLRVLGIAGHYVPLDVARTDLRDTLRAMPRMGFVGGNVTVPHKEQVLEIADSVTDRAALVGAANTLTFREDGRILADNTDGYGFMENLRQGAPDWQPRAGPAAVFGAGGAARAVLTSLIDAGVTEIRLTNRTRARSEALRKEFGAKIVVYDWTQAGNIVEDAATVVNASVLGMVGKPEFRVPLDGLSRSSVVTDLVYTPVETAFLAQARAMGCTVVDGVGMLIWQAVPGFERWFGARPPVDESTRAAVLGP
ncbi:shikimate 5-dehydrogenase [Oceaniovalibus guishaninsula JLT2003]|uniref:Shikimate dehydrogenase (NADP(+)) n=1 Tax=Oceaniovalibus guishaninsula JLT2003 TaxID=1231392 RepID=K2I6S7_9RHOB|nr:shikimate dehydrogenase [Oceaniovalibus guishaninsula]EKE44675.1 shikimate 5-dehydrogenase [Oceaniovalibus guishaninsula JLT2003]